MTSLIDLNIGSVADAATEYISRGWPVLPLRPREKTPLTKHGLLDATTDPAITRGWLKRWPKMNIGLRTGVAFDVLDVDGPAGTESLSGIAAGYRHTGPVAATGKGYHALFQVTGARNAANKQPGLDFRGQNGYIVVSPSIHPSGHQYRWLRDGELPEPPDWLYSLLTPPASAHEGGIDPTNMSPIVQIWEKFPLYSAKHPLVPVGLRYRTDCPWHQDDTPSFYLFPENNSFFCFGCNEWGDSINLSNIAAHAIATGEFLSPSEMRTK